VNADRNENQPPCSWWIARLYREPTTAEIADAAQVRAQAKARLHAAEAAHEAPAVNDRRND